MKTSTFILVFFLMTIINAGSYSQDLSGLFPFAHYPLVNTQEDALGFQNNMVLMNTQYEGADGIYFNGKHPVVDQGGAWARTTYMAALMDPKFAVQVEFRIEDLDDQLRCIAVCGLSTLQQYLGLFVSESDFVILLSNNELITLQDVNAQANVWYKLTMIYDTVTNDAKFYLGNNLIEGAVHQVVRIPGDAFVSNYYPGGGYPMKGNWRNLRIYGTEEITALEDELLQASAIRIFPNPAVRSQIVTLTSDQPITGPVRVFSSTGTLVKELNRTISTETNMHMDVSGLSPGIYVVTFPSGTIWNYARLIIL